MVDRIDAEDAAQLLQEHFRRLGVVRPKEEPEEMSRGGPCEAAKQETKDELKDELKDEAKDEMKEEKEEVSTSFASYGTVTAKWLDTEGTCSQAETRPPGAFFRVPLAQPAGVCLDLDSD